MYFDSLSLNTSYDMNIHQDNIMTFISNTSLTPIPRISRKSLLIEYIIVNCL